MGTFFDDASLVMIPSGVKDGKVYSIKPTDGTGDFTFSRGTDTATRVNSSGLIEKERSNQLLQSNQFDTTWFFNGFPTLTGGQSGYDGTNDAWSLAGTGLQYASVRQTIAISGIVTLSVYAKAGTQNFLAMNTGSSSTAAWFDLANGTRGSTDTNVVDSAIESIGGSWYRCSMSIVGITEFRIYVTDADNNFGTATGNILIQDAQLEQGLVATDYIETTTAPVYVGITDNLPRLDYSGGASCPSLLLEPQRTNLIPSSEDIDSVWSKLRVSVENNNTTSPEGFVNAGKTTATAVAGTHASYDTLTGSVTAGNDYFISCFVKKATTKYIRLNEGYSGAYVTFNFDDQTTDLQNGASNLLLEEHANGWYRLGFKFTADSSGNSQFALYINDDNNNTSYTGSGEAVYFWGAQVEAGSYPTSYIPTYGTSASRAKDFINQNIQTLTSGLTEGTLFVEFEKPNTGENVDLMRLRGSGTLGRAYIYNTAAGFASDWGTAQNFTIGENTKAAWRLDSLSSGVEFINGVKGVGGSGTAWSDIRLLRFNADGNGGVLKIKQILFFPTALTDSECITLTTL
jgi:hypothetical protein